MAKYLVKVSRKLQPLYEYCEVEIEAKDDMEALENAEDKAITKDDWSTSIAQDYEWSYDVEDITLLEDEK